MIIPKLKPINDSKKMGNSPSTICPTRRSIIDGKGSSSTTGLATLPFLLLDPLLFTGSAAAALCLSFLSFLGSSTGGVEEFEASLVVDSILEFCADADTVSLDAFSFFFGGSVFLSVFGAFSRSKDKSLKVSPNDSAEARMGGLDWIWSKYRVAEGTA